MIFRAASQPSLGFFSPSDTLVVDIRPQSPGTQNSIHPPQAGGRMGRASFAPPPARRAPPTPASPRTTHRQGGTRGAFSFPGTGQEFGGEVKIEEVGKGGVRGWVRSGKLFLGLGEWKRSREMEGGGEGLGGGFLTQERT